MPPLSVGLLCRPTTLSLRRHSHTPLRVLPSATPAGALARAPSLAAKLLELCARHEAGWKEQAAPQPLAAPEAAAKAPPPPPPAAEGCWGSGPHADADAVPAALAAQLRMGPPAPAASAGTDGSTASAQLPPHLVQQQAPALADEWDYLAPDGISVYGPFSLEQLQFWVGQGHMAADVQVQPAACLGPRSRSVDATCLLLLACVPACLPALDALCACHVLVCLRVSCVPACLKEACSPTAGRAPCR